MLKTKWAFWAVLAILLLSQAGYAESIGGPYPCLGGTCDGAVYTLHYSGLAMPDADPLHETFRVTLDIDTNTYTGGGKYLDDVAIKVSSSVFNFALVSAPDGVANWGIAAGGISAGGCSGSGSGFECVYGLANGGKGVSVTTGNGTGTDYSFVFDVTVDNGGLFLNEDGASIKARYVDGNGRKIGALLSEDITLQGPPTAVPEPATMLLLGLGLLGAAGARRTFKK
jgi:PEP-CTERM motif